MTKIWDISPFIDENSDVFPGDSKYSQTLHFQLNSECPVNVSQMSLSPHTGAHADAPLHYANDQAAIGLLALSPYLGPCRVIECFNSGDLIQPQHIQHALQNLPPRIILKTSIKASQSWDSFSAIHADTLKLLKDTIQVQKLYSELTLEIVLTCLVIIFYCKTIAAF
jgi:arylformamidase